ncbi:hypothetical protein Tco_0731284 [Tanacetum coccineum]
MLWMFYLRLDNPGLSWMTFSQDKSTCQRYILRIKSFFTPNEVTNPKFPGLPPCCVSVGIGGVTDSVSEALGCIREMSQSLSSNVPNKSLEQEAATGHSTPRGINSPTSQATQSLELGKTLTPATGREYSHEMNKPSAPTPISQVPEPSRIRDDAEISIIAISSQMPLPSSEGFKPRARRDIRTQPRRFVDGHRIEDLESRDWNNLHDGSPKTKLSS